MAGSIISVQLKQIEGMTLSGRGKSNHRVVMDTSEAFGGTGSASSPLELFLMGLGGCTTMDMISILKKKRLDVRDVVVELSAERIDEHPKIFKEISILFKVYGKNIKESAVARAIELSQTKYCAAAAMVSPTVPVKTSYEIIEID